MQIQKQQKKNERKKEYNKRKRTNLTTSRGAHTTPSLSPHSSLFFSQSHHGILSSPPFSLPLSLAVLLFSLLGRLLPPPPSSPLPLRYIGRDWIGKGAPGEFEPNQNPHLSRLVLSRFPPPALPPSADAASGRTKCREICARDAVPRRSLPPSSGPRIASSRISLVAQVSKLLQLGWSSWLSFHSFSFLCSSIGWKSEWWGRCLWPVQCCSSGFGVCSWSW